MKKIILPILILFVLAGCTEVPVDNNPIGSIPPAEHVTAPENNGYKIGQQNYDVALAENINTNKALQYKLGDKYLSMKPVEIKIDGKKLVNVKSKNAKINKKKYEYKGIFGDGIDLDMNFGDRNWNKVIKIDSLGRFGKKIDRADIVEIWFEFDTNFVVDGWNKQDYFEITDKVRIGDYSYLETAYLWDSYSEEVCEEACEDYCDPDCTQEDEIKTGCDYCDPCGEICHTERNKIKIKSYLTTEKGQAYYVKRIPVEWLKTAEFPVYTDADVTYGTAAEYDSQLIVTPFTEVAKIDTDKFVVCTTDYDNSGDCYIGSVSGTTISSYGSVATFNSDIMPGAAYSFGLCVIDDNKFVVAYIDDALADDGYTEVGSVSGTSISFDTAIEFYNGDAEYIGCGTLEDNKYAIAYNAESSSNLGYAVVCTVSGTTPSCGTASQYSDAADYQAKYNNVCGLEDTTNDSFVVLWENDNWGKAQARVAYSSGTTISGWGTMSVLEETSNFYHDCDTLALNKFIGVWSDSTANVGSSIICTVDGSYDLSCGSIADYGAGGTETAGNSVAKIDSTHFVASFEDRGNSEYGTSVYSSFSGTTITQGDEETFSASQTGFTAIALIDTDKIIICYLDDSDGDSGQCIVGTTPSSGEATPDPPRKGQIIFFD